MKLFLRIEMEMVIKLMKTRLYFEFVIHKYSRDIVVKPS